VDGQKSWFQDHRKGNILIGLRFPSIAALPPALRLVSGKDDTPFCGFIFVHQILRNVVSRITLRKKNQLMPGEKGFRRNILQRIL
jgi:hypothetical protein